MHLLLLATLRTVLEHTKFAIYLSLVCSDDVRVVYYNIGVMNERYCTVLYCSFKTIR